MKQTLAAILAASAHGIVIHAPSGSFEAESTAKAHKVFKVVFRFLVLFLCISLLLYVNYCYYCNYYSILLLDVFLLQLLI